MTMQRNKRLKNTAISALLLAVSLIAVIGIVVAINAKQNKLPRVENSVNSAKNPQSTHNDTSGNPLAGKKLYIDTDSDITHLANQVESQGLHEQASKYKKIANQPQAIWLIGPTDNDPEGNNDIQIVRRSSAQSVSRDSTPVYQLYAIPKRDACAAYSKNGFSNQELYLKWLEKILQNVNGSAIFLVEADAVAHTVQANCLNNAEKESRYALLNKITTRLGNDEKVLAAYLDAGHSEWFKDPSLLVEPLHKSGVNNIRGVAVNVSFFVPTSEVKTWTDNLLAKLDTHQSAIIDTSRNGRGLPPANVKGEARWCNPKGRGLGTAPTTNTGIANIDAYLWVKRPGESDGQCFGYPPAGKLSSDLALELVK